MRFRFGLVAALAGLLFAGASAEAQDYGTPSTGFAISELRAGVLAHDVYPNWIPWDVTSYKFDQIEDISAEMLIRLPDVDAVRWMGSPKLNLGATLNLDGQESLAHLALTWQMPVADTPVFVEASIGGAVHNGILTGPFLGRGSLRPQGARIQFYTSAGIGIDITDTVYAMISYEHMSNADLATPNYGVSNMGIKLGVRLD